MELYQKRGDDLVQLVAPGIGADVPLSDAVDSDSSVTAASSRAVKAAWDKAVEAMESVPLPAGATPRSAGTASVGASGRWAREDHVHPVAIYQQSVSMSGSSAAIDYDSPNFILYSVSGATTINFQRKSNASVKYLYFWGWGARHENMEKGNAGVMAGSI